MKTTLVLTLLALGLSGGLAASGANAQEHLLPPGAARATVTPKLAPNVKAYPTYEVVLRPLALATPTPIFADLNELGATTGKLDRIGEPVTLLAKVKDWDWFLVGRDGVGIGYVPHSMLMPAKP